MNFKIKTGFGGSDFVSISSEELHKAYFLFLNPEQRAIFSNGVALIGKNIMQIEPDYHKEMGWNPTWKLQDDDWSELRLKGLDRRANSLMANAKQIAYNAQSDKNLLGVPMSKIEINQGYLNGVKELSERMRLK